MEEPTAAAPRDESGLAASMISVTVRTLERETFDVYAPRDERVEDFKVRERARHPLETADPPLPQARVARSCVALRPSWRQQLVFAGDLITNDVTLSQARETASRALAARIAVAL